MNELAAGVIAKSPFGRVLMMRRTDGQGWAFPGGGIKDGEEPQACAIREFLEETGYRLGRIKPLMRRVKDGVDFATFVSDVDEEFAPKLNHEHDSWGWIDPQSVLDEVGVAGLPVTAPQLARGDDFGTFKEEDHPRGKSGATGGQFVKKGEEGAEAGEPAEGKEKPSAAEPTGGEPGKPGKPGAAKPGKPGAPKGGSVAPSPTRAGGEEFVSPSVESNLTFGGARQALDSPRQKAMLKTGDEIDRALGLKETARSVIGAWSDGAENSTLAELPDATWDQIKVSAAMKGYVGDQKAVLAFKQDDHGSAMMYDMHVKGELEDIHKRLLKDGLPFHSLAPTKDGADVYVADLDGSALAGIQKAAEDFDAKATYQRGDAQFLGTTKEDGSDREIRDDARRAYEDIIRQSPVPDAEKIWDGNRDRWGQAVEGVKAPAGKKLEAQLKEIGYPPDKVNPAALAPGRLHALSALPIFDAPAYQGKRNVGDVAKALVERGQSWLKEAGYKNGRVSSVNTTPEIENAMASVIADEAKRALKAKGNASDWYKAKTEDAIKVAAIRHPEIAAPKSPARVAFSTALAITSQGETVWNNAGLAMKAYESWKANTNKHGEHVFNLTEGDIGSKNAGPMLGNFKKYDQLVNDWGEEKARAFLSEQMPAKRLVDEFHKKPNGVKVDDEVYGSAIFGAKIGQGFFQNLTGNYDPVTQDLWFMRTFGRMAGTLRDTLKTQKGVDELYGRFRRALGQAGRSIPNSDEGVDKLAREVFREAEADYKKNGEDYRAKTKTQPELFMAAKRMDAYLDGVNEQPGSASDRAWRAGIIGRALEQLKADGLPMSAADLQATIWYPEKDIWKRMGSKGPQGGNADYSGALQEVLRKQGMSDGELEKHLGRKPDPGPPEPKSKSKSKRADDEGGRWAGRGLDDRGDGERRPGPADRGDDRRGDRQVVGGGGEEQGLDQEVLSAIVASVDRLDARWTALARR